MVDESEAAGLGGAEAVCPRCGGEGQAVGWQTVAALVRGPLPPRQDYLLCRAAACDIVYFGSRGVTILVRELQVEPGFKNREDGLLCYCFDVRCRQVEREILDTGKTSIPESITAATRAGNCACEVRNPSGHCCLGEMRRFVADISSAAEARS